MMQFLANLWGVLGKTAPYWGLFLGAFALGYVLTPLVRELSRACGMVDKPNARRINKVPTPRGGGVAVFLAVSVVVAAYMCIADAPLLQNHPNWVLSIWIWLPIG